MDKLRIQSSVGLLRRVVLPVDGTVCVRTGNEVNTGDLIAEINLPEKFQVFDVVNQFKVNPRKIEKYIKRLAGESVKTGDVIAQQTGLISRFFRASQDGQVVSVREGKVTVALGERKLQVFANLPGTVVELIPNRGAVIALQGSIIQGVWGNGRFSEGELACWNCDQESPEKADLTDNTGKILYSERVSSPKDLQKLLLSKPSGLIVPCIPSALAFQFSQLKIAVMSLVGFGDCNFDPYSQVLLKSMTRKNVYLVAERLDRSANAVPELICPEEQSQPMSLFEEKTELAVGSIVRLLGAPYTGTVGVVTELPEHPEKFTSGLDAKPAIVQRDDGQLIHLPRENLQLLLT